jgi:hypothetical protein
MIWLVLESVAMPLTTPAAASAQAAKLPRYKFQVGQALVYKGHSSSSVLAHKVREESGPTWNAMHLARAWL